jgi:hypothetical protein
VTENTTYICDYCGEVFDDSEDCFQHEWEHKFELVKNRVKFMKEKDGIFIELPLTCESADECTIIYCDGTDEAWDIIEEAFDWRGYGYPTKDIRADGHIFVYDYDTSDWFCLEKKMNYFIGLSNKINKVIRGN